MVDNFALVVSQLMMLIVLYRCYTLPEVGDEEPRRPRFGRKPASPRKPR
jgi:hypothetical protein